MGLPCPSPFNETGPFFDDVDPGGIVYSNAKDGVTRIFKNGTTHINAESGGQYNLASAGRRWSSAVVAVEDAAYARPRVIAITGGAGNPPTACS